MTEKKNPLHIKTFILILAVFIFLIYRLYSEPIILVISIIIASVYTMIMVHKNIILLIVSFLMLYANYSICLFFWADIFGVRNNQSILWFTDDEKTMQTALMCIYLFEVVILLTLPQTIVLLDTTKESIFGDAVNSSTIGILVILIIIIVSGYDIFRTITSGIYVQTSLFEYLSVMFIIGFYYTKSIRMLKCILSLLLFVDCLYVFFNGDRGAAIQFIIIYYVMFLSNKISNTKLLFFVIVGMLFLTVIGSWRGTKDITSDLVFSSIKNLFSKGIMSDTAYYAGGAGLSFIKMTTDFSIIQRISMLGSFLVSMIVGSSLLNGYVPLATLSFQLYPHHSYGGFLPCFGFFYLGYFGVVICGFMVTKALSIIATTNKDSTVYHKLLCVYLTATAYRWYLYSPSQMLRGPLLLFVVYKATNLFISRKEKMSR